MSKKKILIIFTGAMEIGGIEKSLIGLLSAIDYTCYDVDLFLYGHHGPLFDMIDRRVNILDEVNELAYLRESIFTKLMHRCFYSAFLRLNDYFLSYFRPVNNDKTWAKILRKCVKKLKTHYDLAISFFRPFDFITEKVDADLKIGWVHTDYSSLKTDLIAVKNDYSKVPYIAAVSEQCKESFGIVFPELINRLLVVENIYPVQMIIQDAELFDVSREMPNDGYIKLLSIGRFSEAKNFDNIPDICSRILKKGMHIKWYLIGYGNDEQLIRQKIAERNVQNNVIILGKKENPYPYIKACDLYVQPSRYEGKCVSVIEAQILQKPVVITKYATSGSQLIDGVDGIIVPIDNNGCAEGITDLLRNKDLLKKLAINCGSKDYSNRTELNKIYKLLEDYENKNNHMP